MTQTASTSAFIEDARVVTSMDQECDVQTRLLRTRFSCILAQALQQCRKRWKKPPGMTQTGLTRAFVGHARVVTSTGPECDIETQSCPLHLTMETPWGPVKFTMPFVLLPGGRDVVIIGQKTLREKLGVDVIAQLQASVP